MVVGESRSELLKWLNSTLELNYTKIEQCGTGAAFIQLIDSIYINDNIELKKVKFQPRNEFDYRHNWKLLQKLFTKYNITKNIDVERLIKCRLQDNLELLQWFKRYWSEHKDYNIVYDAQKRRQGLNGITGATLTNNISSSSSPNTSFQSNTQVTPNSTLNQKQLNKVSPLSQQNVNVPYQSPYAQKPRQKQPQLQHSQEIKNRNLSQSGTLKENRVNSAGSRNYSAGSQHMTSTSNKSRSRVTTPIGQQTSLNSYNDSVARRMSMGDQKPNKNNQNGLNNKIMIESGSFDDAQYQELNKKCQMLQNELDEYEISCATLQTERNLYYNKLRDIELMVQHILDLNDENNLDQLQGLDLVQYSKQIQDILYAKEEGFGDIIHHEENIFTTLNESAFDDRENYLVKPEQQPKIREDLDMLDNESF